MKKKEQSMKRLKVYISGKVTGLDPEYMRQKFAKTEEWLRSLGFDTVNPETLVPAGVESWEEAMKICLRAELDCDLLFAQSDAYESKGARVEISVAASLKIHVIHEDGGLATEKLLDLIGEHKRAS
jgi:hypothetical protein